MCPQAHEAGQTRGKGWGLRQVPAPVPAVGSGSVPTRGRRGTPPGCRRCSVVARGPQALPLCSRGRTQPPIPASGRGRRPVLPRICVCMWGGRASEPGGGVAGCRCCGVHSHLGGLDHRPLPALYWGAPQGGAGTPWGRVPWLTPGSRCFRGQEWMQCRHFCRKLDGRGWPEVAGGTSRGPVSGPEARVPERGQRCGGHEGAG